MNSIQFKVTWSSRLAMQWPSPRQHYVVVVTSVRNWFDCFQTQHFPPLWNAFNHPVLELLPLQHCPLSESGGKRVSHRDAFPRGCFLSPHCASASGSQRRKEKMAAQGRSIEVVVSGWMRVVCSRDGNEVFQLAHSSRTHCFRSCSLLLLI